MAYYDFNQAGELQIVLIHNESYIIQFKKNK